MSSGDDDAQRGELHFPAFDLFAQVFRRAPDHQAADEHCQNGVQDHIHQTDALAAEYYVQHHVQQRDHAAQRRQGVVHIVHRTGRKRGRDGGEHRRLRNTEADLLALHTAHGLVQAISANAGLPWLSAQKHTLRPMTNRMPMAAKMLRPSRP